MRIAIVHLSDIHLRSGVDNAPIRRVEDITRAVSSIAAGVDSCLLLLSGDIAFQGSESEYGLAREWLKRLSQRLGSELATPDEQDSVPVHIVGCPGNHDCDFSGEQMVREVILREVSAKQLISAKDDRPLIDEAIKVQDEFFRFLDDVGTAERVASPLSLEPRVCYECRFSVNDEKVVRVVCLNTAWMSRLHEQPGTLRFPHEVIPDTHDDEALSIVAFHHPVNWLEPNNGRAFRERVEKFADLILTGHEHISHRSERSAEGSISFTHMEGGVLQESANPNISDFGVLTVDLEKLLVKHHRCTWNGDLYETKRVRLSSGGDENGWEEFPLNLARRQDVVRIAPDWDEYLNNPGVMLSHPKMTRMRLSDIYIFPDLREVELRKETLRTPVRVIRSESVFAEIIQHQHVLITGDTQSGKTSLAKVLFLKFYTRGDLPILIRDELARSLPQASQIEEFLMSAMFTQYRCASPDVLRQIPRSRRVVIFDDSHRVSKLSRAAKNQFLSTLTTMAGRVILLGHDVYVGLDELLSPDKGVTFKRFRILPFGHISRNALVERWLTLGRESEPVSDARELVRTLNQMMQIIDTLVGRNFVVPYPVYILAVLQAAEAAVNIDAKASTHGYFYELLIKASLAKGSGKIPYDILASYLSFMAFRMLESGVFELDRSTWHSIHDKFNQSRDLEYEFDLFHSHLQVLEILHKVGDVYRFKYGYFFYYFLASYMRDHIGRADVRGIIVGMAGALHVEMNSNVLLFLAHLSKDPFIIDEMLKAAKGVFAEHEPASLDEDVAFLADFATELAESKFLNVFQEGDTIENRRKVLEAVDQREQPGMIREVDRVAEGGAPEHLDDPCAGAGTDGGLDPLARLNGALKTAQILGQIVKNFPGSLEGDQKAEIVRECTDLILRALTWFMNLLSGDEERIVDEVMELLRDPAHPLSRAELQSGAKAIVFGLASLASYGFIKRASSAVGSTLLTRTYGRVFSDGTPAQALIDASLDLDHAGAFPVDKLKSLGGRFKKRNPFAHMLLRGFVIQHFHLFPVAFATKQRVCAALDITYEGGEKSNPRAKLLDKKKG